MFKRKPKPQPPADRQQLADMMARQPITPKAGIAKLLPFGEIIKGITGVLRDPNGKISSKRAGAGALVTAGIYFLEQGQLPAGITCLGFATALFFLTKFDAQP